LSGVRIPADALAVRVERDGRVLVDTPSGKGRTIARLRLASFASPEALRSLGATLFAPTEGSGRARLFTPGGRDAPSIAFGMLERSNVVDRRGDDADTRRAARVRGQCEGSTGGG